MYCKSDITCRAISISGIRGISIAARRMNRATGNNAVSLAACITDGYRMKVFSSWLLGSVLFVVL